MEERPEPRADTDFELTPEELVAADEAMLLDLGSAERLADLIADQSLGETGSRATSAPEGPADAPSAPPADENDPSSPR